MLGAIIKTQLILGLGFCLAVIAIPTTLLALYVLFFRLILTYFDLFVVRLFLAFAGSSRKSSHLILPVAPSSTPKQLISRNVSRSGSRRSSVSRKSSLRRDPDNEISRPASAAGSTVSLADGDFEGVGGWRLPQTTTWEDDDEALYIGAGVRHSPAIPRRRHHHGNLTGGSQRFSGHATPEVVRTPRTPVGQRRHISRPTSPENYFSYLPAAGSTTSLHKAEGSSRVSFDTRLQSARSSLESERNSMESMGIRL